MKVHSIFSPDRLRKAPVDPLPGQVETPTDPVQITTEDEWEVHQVLASRLVRNKLEYRIDWLGHDEDLNWYPVTDIKYAPAKLREFHLQNPTQPGPPRQLLQWQKAMGRRIGRLWWTWRC